MKAVILEMLLTDYRTEEEIKSIEGIEMYKRRRFDAKENRQVRVH